MYRILRSILFLFPTETAHYLSMNTLKLIVKIPGMKSLFSSTFILNDSRLEKEVWGLKFRNGVGLGAGFDKNARYLKELQSLGFGFVEIGTVTPRPQDGNPKPRLFRLLQDKALINRMGFNNEGLQVISNRLKKWKALPEDKRPMLVGGNIGKNKDTANEEAWKDYQSCFRTLHPYVDFFVINVSSPNTPALRALQERGALEQIFSSIRELNNALSKPLPLLLKIAPDLSEEQIREVVELAREISLDGLVCTNTTLDRNNLTTDHSSIGMGGLSGLPLKNRSTEVLKLVHSLTEGKMILIGSGGIFTPSDAEEKWENGAGLIEVWTGFIYEGPLIVKRICKQYLKQYGTSFHR